MSEEPKLPETLYYVRYRNKRGNRITRWFSDQVDAAIVYREFVDAERGEYQVNQPTPPAGGEGE